ncbi:hypothetical protein ABW636_06120 [Aquimarina sp. 2201CG1-2-11]|uniref:hypothetical protein n=1 Tax=Aquimarina discodermiae TaxID=3231043 RepID=UPI00346259DB
MRNLEIKEIVAVNGGICIPGMPQLPGLPGQPGGSYCSWKSPFPEGWPPMLR